MLRVLPGVSPGEAVIVLRALIDNEADAIALVNEVNQNGKTSAFAREYVGLVGKRCSRCDLDVDRLGYANVYAHAAGRADTVLYFACQISDHCDKGQKISVRVEHDP